MTVKLIALFALASMLPAQEQLEEVQEAHQVQKAKATAQSKPTSRPMKKAGSKIIKQPVWKSAPGVGRFQFSGAPFTNKKLKSFSASQLKKKFKDLQGKPIRLYGMVEKTCPKKGCWMWVKDIKDPKTKIWVRFKDYGFFVPKKGAAGRLVVLEGSAKEVTFDVKTARHLKEDEGDLEGAKKITKPVKMIQVTATSVMILQSKKARKGSAKPAKENKDDDDFAEVEEVEEKAEKKHEHKEHEHKEHGKKGEKHEHK